MNNDKMPSHSWRHTQNAERTKWTNGYRCFMAQCTVHIKSEYQMYTECDLAWLNSSVIRNDVIQLHCGMATTHKHTNTTTQSLSHRSQFICNNNLAKSLDPNDFLMSFLLNNTAGIIIFKIDCNIRHRAMPIQIVTNTKKAHTHKKGTAVHSNGNDDIRVEIKVWYFHLLTTKCAEYAKFNLSIYLHFTYIVPCRINVECKCMFMIGHTTRYAIFNFYHSAPKRIAMKTKKFV